LIESRDAFSGSKRPRGHELVDIRRWPIRAIVHRGNRTEDAQYPLDVIVFATGYDAMTGPFLNIDIRGREGAELWKEASHIHALCRRRGSLRVKV
jgi:hypothetical protein